MALALDGDASGSRDLGPSTLRLAVSPSSSSSSPSSLSLSSSSLSTRTCLSFNFKDVKFKLAIPDSHFALVESQRNTFLSSYAIQGHASSTLQLALEFLDFLLDQQTIPRCSLFAVLQAFESEFLGDEVEIHSLIANSTPRTDERQKWLGTYYRLREASDPGCSRRHLSALFQHAKASQFQTMAIFGGQGESSRTCVREFEELYTSYKPLLRRLLGVIGPCLYDLSSRDEFRSYYKGQKIDLESWLRDPTSAPDLEFVSSAPVSVPVIGSLSLARYCITCHLAGCDPGEFRSMLHASTGHSQGLLAAIAIAASGSWDEFYQVVQQIVELLFFLGWECHRAAPCSMVLAANYVEFNDATTPSYMLSIRGLRRQAIEATLNQVNASLPQGQQMCLALVNAFDQFVAAGPVASLLRLENYLTSISETDNDQSRVPFKKRKPCIQCSFLPVSTPFHTPYLVQAAERVKVHFSDRVILSRQLKIPVYHTRTGLDIRQQNGNVLSIAIDAIASEQCNWPTAISAYPASHILAFDRGGLPALTKRVKEGYGVRVLQASDLDSRDPDMGTMRDLFAPKLLDSSTRLRSWDQQFQPTLSAGGKVRLETRLNRILGAPPIMVAGMTPTTVHPDFVAAIMNAGYHAEIAGGGYHNASAMEAAIHDLVRNIPQGRGVTCNLIYANPRAISWQIPLLRRLSHSGVPIDGLTIGAGVPSLQIASEYIKTLGLRHISFKPSSISTIRQVIEIAKRHPTFPVILQWTGGRGGGHHSFEDFHAPIIATYGVIRQQPNVYLIAGSGFGDSDSVYPYLSGSWSTAMGHPAMPFDGVLLGSRMMVAKEAHTSTTVRQIITATPGVTDAEWEGTYTGATGGVITVTSEMGEPIHKIATRGVRLWAEMDKAVFSLSQPERMAYLVRHRRSIIRRLNADFAKPWFGCNADGEAIDLEEMTYFDVLKRSVELMCVGLQRWIDPSYVELTMTLARRWLERLPFVESSAQALTIGLLQESPGEFLDSFANACPAAKEDFLNPEDISFFLLQCKRPGRKPVNFIPALDENFEVYFKKDSLWQAEDIDAVIGRDVQRICILQGPVAAQYSNFESEPAAYILNCIMTGVVSRLKEDVISEELVPSLKSGLTTPASWSTLSSNERDLSSEETSDTSITSLSDLTDDHSLSSGGVEITPGRRSPPWMQALLENEFLLQDNVRQKNPFRWLLHTTPTSLDYDADAYNLMLTVHCQHGLSTSAKAICHNGVDIVIEITPPKASEPLRLHYNYSELGLREVMKGRNERIKSFYSRLWFARRISGNETAASTFYGPITTLSHDFLDEYAGAVGPAFADHRQMNPNTDVLPIHVGIIIAWDVISRPLTIGQIGGDLLRLVHCSNTFEYYSNAVPLRLGDTVSSESRIQAVYEDEGGRVLVVEARLLRAGAPVMTITSTFLFRGSKDSMTISAFRMLKERRWTFEVTSQFEQSLLLSRNWFQPRDCSLSLVGKTITFALVTTNRHQSNGLVEVEVTGKAVSQSNGFQQQELGTVNFKDTCTRNPVLDFLERRGQPAEARTKLESPGWAGQSTMEIEMPPSNQPYAQLSGDHNPIHTSPIFANLAGLPGTICHGMCTSAIVEKVLEHLGLEGNRERLRRFEARFVDMVMPKEKLVIKLKHIGMVEGRMRFAITANRKETDEQVLDADAEVEQPRTAYLFTGQGSQSKGMGMGLYNSSPVAKAVWDEIDQQLFDGYGWSVLDIVRNNPKSLTVHFGGRNGRRIRQRYLKMTTEVVLSDGSRAQKSVLAGLTPTSTSYTFTHPKGLLYSTQFAQPAILLFEAAAFAELRAKGYVSSEAVYAGHSLGEFGALSALSRSIPTGALVELAFYRGSVMQASVARDDQDATTYGMVAMNPKRVGKCFTQTTLGCLVSQIAAQSQELLEIVNFNVEGEQYVCSGTVANLYVLGKLIDHIASAPEAPGCEPCAANFQDIIDTLLTEAKRLPRPIQLRRGKATVPLEGIDVPFHSSHLRNTVDRFRQCLLRPGFLVDNIDVEQLVGRYIPNLMARPFSLDREYIQEAFKLTQSPVLRDILDDMDS